MKRSILDEQARYEQTHMSADHVNLLLNDKMLKTCRLCGSQNIKYGNFIWDYELDEFDCDFPYYKPHYIKGFDVICGDCGEVLYSYVEEPFVFELEPNRFKRIHMWFYDLFNRIRLI